MVLLDNDASFRRYCGPNGGYAWSNRRPARVDPKHHARTSSTRLRSNLLRKLGIPPSSTSMAARAAKHPGNISRRPVSLLGNVQIEKLPLKSNDDGDLIVGRSTSSDRLFLALGSHLWNSSSPTSSPSHSNSSILAPPKPKKTVHFDPQVSAVLIPSRHEYSARIARFLWDSPQLMYTNIVRNTLEYRSDGWDWEAVLEEEDHCYNPSTREYVHPIHLEIADMAPEEQAMFVPAGYLNPALTIMDDDNNTGAIICEPMITAVCPPPTLQT